MSGADPRTASTALAMCALLPMLLTFTTEASGAPILIQGTHAVVTISDSEMGLNAWQLDGVNYLDARRFWVRGKSGTAQTRVGIQPQWLPPTVLELAPNSVQLSYQGEIPDSGVWLTADVTYTLFDVPGWSTLFETVDLGLQTTTSSPPSPTGVVRWFAMTDFDLGSHESAVRIASRVTQSDDHATATVATSLAPNKIQIGSSSALTALLDSPFDVELVDALPGLVISDGDVGHAFQFNADRNDDFQITTVMTLQVPEPFTIILLGLGVAALGFQRCRSRAPQSSPSNVGLTR